MITPVAVQVRRALASIADPEIPMASIVELGMIEGVEVYADHIRVELLPTFVGCPALEVIAASIRDRLAGFGREVEVSVDFATPWTSDRITPAGRAQLRRAGFAPPPEVPVGRGLAMLDAPGIGGDAAPVACPYCGSLRTTMESAFGPTQCRSVHHCAACRQPFEAFKAI